MIAMIYNIANASTFVCRRQMENDNTQLVLISDSVLLTCQSPNSVNLNQDGMKAKYCSAASIMISQNTTTQLNGSLAGTINAQVVSSVLNNMPEGLNVELDYKQNSEGVIGHIKVSESIISSAPEITLPNEADYTCVMR